MKKTIVLAFAVGIAGLSACTHLRSPTDEQLLTLLQAERPRSNTVAPIETGTVQCLRAWSNDSKLISGLPAAFVAEADGKRSCRLQLDRRLADAERNPAKYSFQDITAPAVVQRVIALATPDRLAAPALPASPANAPGPAAMPLGRTPRPGSSRPLSEASVDLGTTRALVKEADDSCKMAKQKATAANAPVSLQRFAKYCDGYITRAQATLANEDTLDAQQVETIARGAKGLTAGAQRAMAQAPRD